MPFVRLRKLLSISSLLSILSLTDIGCCQMLSLHQLERSNGLLPCIVILVNYTDSFSNGKPVLHYWISPTWPWCVIFFIYYCIWFANILFKIFDSVFMRVFFCNFFDSVFVRFCIRVLLAWWSELGSYSLFFEKVPIIWLFLPWM